MKICHFCSTHVDAPYFSYLGKRLTEKGADISFITLNAAETPQWIKEFGRVKYLSLNVSSRLLYPLAVLRLSRFLKQNKIDILQTHLFHAAMIGLTAARLAGTPTKIVSRHHIDDVALTGSKFHVAIDKWASRKADLVVVPSKATRNYMIEVEAHSGENIRVVPYGFDFDMLSAGQDDRQRVRAEFGIDDKFVIGCVGRFFKNKGHRYLFEAVKALVSEFPQIRVLLLGDGDKQMLDEQIFELGIVENVIFAGFRRDVAACMKAMDLLVHPSLSESFGQVIVEAMCVETPVVVTSVGGVPEIVENGKTGIVVDPKNSAALAVAIKSLLVDSEMLFRLAENGRKSVYANFNVEQFIERQWACYEELS